MKLTVGEKVFNVANLFVLAVVGVLCLYPFLYTLSISLSTATEASRGGFHLYPKEVSLVSYRMVLTNPHIVTGYTNTLIRTIVGTVLTLLATCVAAYPLSRKEMPHRSLITFIIVFTMLFNGGLVPGYLLIKKLGLINTVWALILPILITAFNVIIVKNFFQSLPESIEGSHSPDAMMSSAGSIVTDESYGSLARSASGSTSGSTASSSPSAPEGVDDVSAVRVSAFLTGL